MRIIIVGAGEVGFYLAKMLSEENHDVTILDKNAEKCQRAREHLDVLVLEGNGGSAQTLSDAGIKKMDMLIAVTSIDEVNIMACMFANRLGVETKVARVRNAEYSKPRALITPSQLGIDKMIHPEEEASKQIKNLIRRSAASEVAEFSGGRIQVVGIKLGEESPIVGKSLQKIALEHPNIQYRTVAISRNGETLMPSGADTFNLKDHVYFIAKSEDIPEVLRFAGKEQQPAGNIMILGAGKIGRRVAQMLEDKISVKLIEESAAKTEIAAKMLKNTLIIKGDGTDIELLEDEGISDVDAFIAVTQTDEKNVISGILAKDLGVKKAIVHVTRNDLIPVVNKIGIESVVSKSAATVDAILKYIRKGEVVSVFSLEGTDVEAIELIPQLDSKVTQKKIKDCKFPDDSIVGAQIHVNEITIPTGESIIVPGDKVIVFTRAEAISDLEKLFSP